MDEDYICKQCEKPILDIAAVMVNGCDCGCRVFKQVKNNTGSEKKSDGDKFETDDQVSIKVKASGIYNVNLKALINRNTKDEPIFVEDPSGRINVLLNPDT